MSLAYSFGNIEVHVAQRQVLLDGRPTALGGRAFDVLLTLIERRDRLVAKDELIDAVWPGRVVEPNNLAVQVNALRKVLGPEMIVTIPGRGYRFVAPETRSADDGVSHPVSVQFLQDLGDALVVRGAFAGQTDPARAAVEQPDPQLTLQELHMPRHGARRQTQIVGCASEGAGIHHTDEGSHC
jgi:DNA-binding winged helix-turn-helix (wHTH) protein